MPRLSMLVLLAVAITATGCETGSTHENMTDAGAQGQNVGQGSNKPGPVPGSSTGSGVTASATPETTAPAAAPDAMAAPAAGSKQ